VNAATVHEELAYYREEALRLRDLAEERDAQLRFAATERDRYQAAVRRIVDRHVGCDCADHDADLKDAHEALAAGA
jgi:hypothetical protein